jgi:hypothetical protein
MTETWTAPQVERTGPGLILGERQALEAWRAGRITGRRPEPAPR